MILDPTGQFIAMISAHCDIAGKTVLEVGCGKGRITGELAGLAAKVVAIDPDEAAQAKVRSFVPQENVQFVQCRGEDLSFPENSFDAVIYTLSLHHIPSDSMLTSLRQAAGLLHPDGRIIIIEPGEGGAMNEAKERFGAGSGDESEGKRAAIQAMNCLADWDPGETIRFSTLFQFLNVDDFLRNMIPDFRERSAEARAEILEFLARHQCAEGIVLDSERRMNILTRKA